MTEPVDLIRRTLGFMDRAMADEGCPPDLRRRVMNRLIYGHPDGPDARELVDPDERMWMAPLPPHLQDLLDETARFVCPRCGAISTHPDDGAAGYCGQCHDWTGPDRTPRRGATS